MTILKPETFRMSGYKRHEQRASESTFMHCIEYFNMLQDTGISVRKRVIKIFRDIFSVQPDFNKIPDMCVKMIRRVNDEDGIKVQ